MSVDLLPGIVENCARSSHNATDWSTDENCEGPNFPTKCGRILKIKEKKCFFLFFLFYYFVFLAWNKKRQFLKCSQMMSRNSIRLIKGQNWIELIYRVNSESLMMEKKVWTSLLLKHKLLVTRRGALFTFQWESVDSVKRFLLRRSCCFDDKYFSICSRHYSAIPPLNRNYIIWSCFSNSSHITESHKGGKIRRPVIVMHLENFIKYPYVLFWLPKMFESLSCRSQEGGGHMMCCWSTPLV